MAAGGYLEKSHGFFRAAKNSKWKVSLLRDLHSPSASPFLNISNDEMKLTVFPFFAVLQKKPLSAIIKEVCDG